ncbi:hypothetical protein FHT13_002222 [Xanthomonas arboricola]|nr:hypothetical protein [Xanthomonas arboricola]
MRPVLFFSLAALCASCAHTEQPKQHAYGNDALPSAESVAFEKTDARLRYRDARIEWDAKQCAVYQGVAADGQIRSEALHDAEGWPLCAKKP